METLTESLAQEHSTHGQIAQTENKGKGPCESRLPNSARNGRVGGVITSRLP